MSYFKSLLHDKDRVNKMLLYLSTLFFIIILALVFAIIKLPNTWVVHIPPDTRTASQTVLSEVPTSTVYGFAYNVFQQLHRWHNNGEEEYEKNIKALKPLLTPKCEAFLLQDYKDRLANRELQGRARGVYEIVGRGFSENKVEIYSKDSWGVKLDLSVDEYVQNERVKQTFVRYPVNIVRMNVDLKRNPWGLGFNCYTSTPMLLEVIEQKTEENK